MGGLPWDVAARDLPVPEAISQRRAALGIPQATPRAQEAPPQAAKRGQGQACGDGQTAPDTQDQSTKRSKSVYNIISTQGWIELPHDPKDEPYINLAVASGARYLVSRDHHLLNLMQDEQFCQSHPSLTILNPVAFLQEIVSKRQREQKPEQAPERGTRTGRQSLKSVCFEEASEGRWYHACEVVLLGTGGRLTGVNSGVTSRHCLLSGVKRLFTK